MKSLKPMMSGASWQRLRRTTIEDPGHVIQYVEMAWHEREHLQNQLRLALGELWVSSQIDSCGHLRRVLGRAIRLRLYGLDSRGLA